LICFLSTIGDGHQFRVP